MTTPVIAAVRTGVNGREFLCLLVEWILDYPVNQLSAITHATEVLMPEQHDPKGRRLPIKLDTTTNGEFAPLPLEPIHRQARRLASDRASENAKHRGVSRRSF